MKLTDEFELPIERGTRVWVEYEDAWGTVVSDKGIDRRADSGVLVQIDGDSGPVLCAHGQVHAAEPIWNEYHCPICDGRAIADSQGWRDCQRCPWTEQNPTDLAPFTTES